MLLNADILSRYSISNNAEKAQSNWQKHTVATTTKKYENYAIEKRKKEIQTEKETTSLYWAECLSHRHWIRIIWICLNIFVSDIEIYSSYSKRQLQWIQSLNQNWVFAQKSMKLHHLIAERLHTHTRTHTHSIISRCMYACLKQNRRTAYNLNIVLHA